MRDENPNRPLRLESVRANLRNMGLSEDEVVQLTTYRALSAWHQRWFDELGWSLAADRTFREHSSVLPRSIFCEILSDLLVGYPIGTVCVFLYRYFRLNLLYQAQELHMGAASSLVPLPGMDSFACLYFQRAISGSFCSAVYCGDAAGLHIAGPDGKRYQVADLVKEDMEGPSFQINFIILSCGKICVNTSTGHW
jgi:hypothetical protein